MRREFADGTYFLEDSMARQSEKDQADINKIMKRAEQSGIVPLVKRDGEFLDVSEVLDYRGARDQVRKAEEYFMSLPAESRAIFGNDAADFLDAVNDPFRFDELVEAGVIPKGEVRIPAEPVVVAPVGGAVAPVGGTA